MALSDAEIDAIARQRLAAESQPQAPSYSLSDEEIDRIARERLAAERPETAGDRAMGLIGSIGQGASLGYADEAAAGLRSGISNIQQRFGFQPSFQDYDSELAAIRGQQQRFDQAHPYVSTAANIAGALPMPGGLYRKGSTVLSRAGLLALEGAGYGAAYGFGTGEGGFESRAGNALQSAEIGAIAAPTIAGTIGATRYVAGLPGKVKTALSPATRQAQASEAAQRVVREMADDPNAAQAALAQYNSIQPANPARDYLPQYQRTAEISQDPGLATLEEALRRSSDIEPTIQARDALREQARQGIYNRARPDMSNSEAGAAVRTGLQANLERSKETVNSLAERAFKGGEELRTFPAKKSVSDALHTFTKDGSRRVSGEFQTLIDNFRALPPRVDLQTLQNYRSAFGQYASPGHAATTIEKQTASIANQMRKALDNSVDKAIAEGELSKTQGTAWRKMIAASAAEKETFGTGAVKAILKKEGPNLYKIPDSKAPFKALNTPEDARAMMKALGPHIPGKDGMRAALMNHVLEESTNKQTGEFLPNAFARQMRSIQAVAPEVLTKKQQEAIARIGADLTEQGSVKAMAFSASKGNSVTSQSLTAIDAVRGKINENMTTAISVVSPKLGFVLRTAQKLMSQTDIETLVNRELARFVLDPKAAEMMLSAPASKAGQAALTSFADHLQSALPRIEGAIAGNSSGDAPQRGASPSAQRNLFGGARQAPGANPSGTLNVAPDATSIRDPRPTELPPAKQPTKSYKPLFHGSQKPMPKLPKPELEKVVSSVVPEKDRAIMMALIKQESGGNTTAVSKAGAKGLTQLMPAMAKAFGVEDVFDPVQNLQGGYALFQEERDRFKDIRLALAAYNAGSPRVRKAIEKADSRDFDEVQAHLPKETRDYVKRIMSALA